MDINRCADRLLNSNRCHSLASRFRALFELRSLDDSSIVDVISQCFSDPSVLLKHELAYVLGQIQNPDALKTLTDILKNVDEHSMVRHEAAEALGAIGTPDTIVILEQFLNDLDINVKETCEIALERIKFSKIRPNDSNEGLVFSSVDPAFPLSESKNHSDSELGTLLLDCSISLFKSYQAMFSLRNRGTDDAVLELCKGFKNKSALFRHEIAFVLGQLQNKIAIPYLIERLEDVNEASMVRHECAEALGSIASDICLYILNRFLEDDDIIVRESCLVALDMYEFENNSLLV